MTTKSVLRVLGVFAFVVLVIIFLIWAIQTAWLGSFPGRDTDVYRFWFYVQLAVSAGSVVMAIVVWKVAKRKQGSPRSETIDS
jgi:H+/Cl- antiporter ClcA